MKKILVTIAAILSLCTCTSSCSLINPKEPVDTQSKGGIEGNPLDTNVELTLYTGGAYNLKDDEIRNNIIEKLNDLSRTSIGVTIRLAYTDSTEMQPLWKDDVPDIMVATGIFDMIYNANMASGYVSKNTLVSYYNEKYIDEVSEYINEKTPYLSLFYTKFPAFRDVCMVDGKQVGIAIPESYVFNVPVFAVQKSVAREFIHDYENITDIKTALDLCKEIMDRRNDESRKMYATVPYILLSLIETEDYYDIFWNLSRMYFVKYNDPDNRIYRLDETELPDKIFEKKKELMEYSFKTDMNDLIKDINKNAVDAFILDGIRLLDSYDRECPTLLEDYVFYPMYDSVLRNRRMSYFTVSAACEEKQLALMYIDWLFSNDEARKFIGYGIEGVNYNFDQQTKTIYYSDDVRPVSLISIGTGNNFSTIGNSVFGSVNEAAYYKEKVYERYEPDYMADIINQITDYEAFIKDVDKFLRNESHLEQIQLESGLKRSVLTFAFDDKTTEASLINYFKSLEVTNNPLFTKALESLFFDR